VAAMAPAISLSSSFFHRAVNRTSSDYYNKDFQQQQKYLVPFNFFSSRGNALTSEPQGKNNNNKF
jgi:hypothetical protein